MPTQSISDSPLHTSLAMLGASVIDNREELYDIGFFTSIAFDF